MSRPLLVIVPTRNRPGNIARFLASWRESSPVSDLVICDDVEASSLGQGNASGLLAWDGGPLTRGMMYKSCPAGQVTTGKLNMCAAEAVERGYENVMFIGDDHVIETRYWDAYLLRAMAVPGRGTSWVYPADGRRSDVPEICMVPSSVVAALGWFALPATRHNYIDHAWSDLALEFDRLLYVPEVMIRHEHYRMNREVARDDVYIRGEGWAADDGAAYLHWRDGGGRAADSVRLRPLFP